jgi:lipoyl(octanoyl) transferase
LHPHQTGRSPAVLDWGRTAYRDAAARQAALVARRLTGEIGDTLVFTEHEPVFTVGLHPGADAHLVWNAERLAREGVAIEKTNRGGDITYHGPGQIVGYPIVSLEARRDLHAYLRFLEEVLIRALAEFGLAAVRRDGLTGIWIERRKIAAIGVAVRRWVAYHGFALNVDPDLAHFGGIVPCGIASAEGTVTSLRAELGRAVAPEEMKRALAAAFASQWGAFLKAGQSHPARA